MDYNKFRKSRDLAWKVLIQNGISSLPVKVTKLANAHQIKCVSYQQGFPIIDELGLSKQCSQNDGFAVRLRHTSIPTIFYDSSSSRQRCRFTIAHELGHILCGHTLTQIGNIEIFGLHNQDIMEVGGDDEHEANVFASRILAPACVLWALHINAAVEIADMCDISMVSAQFRLERMQELYEREKEYLKTKGRSCFCMSPLERDVLKQFQPFIMDRQFDL